MTEAVHPAAPHHLPFFITGPGQTDVLLVVMLVVLLAVILIVGNLYFQLHALPERMAHRSNHVQMQLVAVLVLLALFTHNHLFWIAGLLLALVQLPDFSSPMNSIARSLETLAGRAGSAQAAAEESKALASDPEPEVETVEIIVLDGTPDSRGSA